MKVGGIKTWKELTIGVQQLVRLLLYHNFINLSPSDKWLLIYESFDFSAFLKHDSKPGNSYKAKFANF